MAASARDPEPFWIYLDRWLREHGWNQVRLADAVGVHETVVGRWLHHDSRRRARPGRKTLPRLAQVLEVTVSELVLMNLADQAATDEELHGPARTDSAANTRSESALRARQQTFNDQRERWVRVLGPRMGEAEAEDYFWESMKRHAQTILDAVNLGVAVNRTEDAAVNAASERENEPPREPRGDEGGSLRAHQHTANGTISLPRRNVNPAMGRLMASPAGG